MMRYRTKLLTQIEFDTLHYQMNFVFRSIEVYDMKKIYLNPVFISNEGLNTGIYAWICQIKTK